MNANSIETWEDLERATEAGKREAIQNAIESATIENLSEILHLIAFLPTESEINLRVNQLSKKLNIGKRPLLADIKKIIVDYKPKFKAFPQDCIIRHPSYDVSGGLISLGFKERVFIDGKVEDKTFFILGDGRHFKLVETDSYEWEGKRIVFDLSNRNLLDCASKWDRADIVNFTPEPSFYTYEKVKKILADFIELPCSGAYGLLTAWIIGTYFYQLFNSYPYLFIFGKKMSGKSRLLTLLERLCFNAIKVKGISIPAMADTVDSIRGVLLIDQAESLADKRNTELLGILADSYTAGGGKRRVVEITNKGRRVLEFEAYAPKAFASIREIDSDLKDRCIEIVMSKGEQEYPEPAPHLPIFAETRAMLYRNLLSRYKQVSLLYETSGNGVSQRIRELWRPLETILTIEAISEDEIGEVFSYFMESMAETQFKLNDAEIDLINTISNLSTDEGVALTASDIATHLKTKPYEMNNKALEIWIGKKIKTLNLASKQMGRVKNRQCYLFTAEHISKRKSVYMPKENAIPLQLMQLKENSIAESKTLKNKDLCNVAIDAISFNENENKILEIIGEV